MKYILFIVGMIGANSANASAGALAFITGTLTFAGVWWLLALFGISLIPEIIKFFWRGKIEPKIQDDVINVQPLSEYGIECYANRFSSGVSVEEEKHLVKIDAENRELNICIKLENIARKVLSGYDPITVGCNHNINYNEYRYICRYYYMFFAYNPMSLIDSKLAIDCAAYKKYLDELDKD